MSTRKRLADYIGVTEAALTAAGERTGLTSGDKDRFLTARVDEALHAAATAAATRRGQSLSEYLRRLVEADLAAEPGELGADVRDALRRLVDVYQRSTGP